MDLRLDSSPSPDWTTSLFSGDRPRWNTPNWTSWCCTASLCHRRRNRGGGRETCSPNNLVGDHIANVPAQILWLVLSCFSALNDLNKRLMPITITVFTLNPYTHYWEEIQTNIMQICTKMPDFLCKMFNFSRW